MNDDTDELAEIVRDASQTGAIEPPAALVALLASIDDPINALQREEEAHQLFAAFNNEFGFIQIARFAKTPLLPPDKARYAALLRWLIQELRRWRAADDPRYRTLAAVFIAVQTCDSANRFWPLLPDDIGTNADLLSCLEDLLGHLAIVFTTHGAKAPIWESDAVQNFQKADAAGDWLAIIHGWQLFPPSFPGVPQTHAVRCLYRYDLQRLVRAVAGLRQTPAAMQVAGILTAEQRLALAVASDNPYMQLASIHRTLSNSPVPETLAPVEQGLLTRLLLKVASDRPRWFAWMRIFNAYPFRYPALQAPLADALAAGPEAALDAYVDSVLLVQMEPGRQSVAGCLRQFRLKASPERRAALWTRAHERWRTWDFGKADPNQRLGAIARCELDYAVVGYACECMDELARQQALHDIIKQVSTLDDRWHASFVDLLANWYRLLSKFQPYAHAVGVAGTDLDWLCEIQKQCWPFDPSQQPYLMMKYRVQ